MIKVTVTPAHYEFPVFRDIDAIVAESKRLSSHWFSPDAMRFFNSRVHPDVYGGRFFVSSERAGWDRPRRYTVRMVALHVSDDGAESFTMDAIDETGNGNGFQRFASRSGAHAAAARLAAQVKSGELKLSELFRS
jgi:hypothetical protein